MSDTKPTETPGDVAPFHVEQEPNPCPCGGQAVPVKLTFRKSPTPGRRGELELAWVVGCLECKRQYPVSALPEPDHAIDAWNAEFPAP